MTQVRNWVHCYASRFLRSPVLLSTTRRGGGRSRCCSSWCKGGAPGSRQQHPWSEGPSGGAACGQWAFMRMQHGSGSLVKVVGLMSSSSASPICSTWPTLQPYHEIESNPASYIVCGDRGKETWTLTTTDDGTWRRVVAAGAGVRKGEGANHGA